MTITRRNILAGLAGLASTGASSVLPAFGQWNERDVVGSSRIDREAIEFLLSIDESTEIAGARMAYPRVIAKWGGALRDARVQQAMRDFCQPFWRAAQRSHLPWEVTVSNDVETPNACALGGGKLTFASGMISVCDHPGELAAIVAHEIGHVDLEHWRRDQHLAFIMTKAGDRMLPGTARVGGLEFLAAYFESFQLGWNRDLEAEADDHVEFMFSRVPINLAHAANAMRKFKLLEKKLGIIEDEASSDHPVTSSRIAFFEGLQVFRPRIRNEFIPPGWDILKAAFPTPAYYKTLPVMA